MYSEQDDRISQALTSTIIAIVLDLIYDAVKSAICLAIWDIAITHWVPNLPSLSFWQMYLFVVFFNVVSAGRLNE